MKYRLERAQICVWPSHLRSKSEEEIRLLCSDVSQVQLKPTSSSVLHTRLHSVVLPLSDRLIFRRMLLINAAAHGLNHSIWICGQKVND